MFSCFSHHTKRASGLYQGQPWKIHYTATATVLHIPFSVHDVRKISIFYRFTLVAPVVQLVQ